MEFRPPKIFVGETKSMGRGVFAGRDFTRGDLIERAPCVIDKNTCFTGEMKNYIFFENSNPKSKSRLIALGYVSLYNHSNNPSAEYTRFDLNTMDITAVRDIKKGEEIKISYGTNYWKYRGITPK
jgi:SET domain-containing protein